ncbi:ArsR/SmtB family transcription factor [Cohnella thailandensis]|uniref:Helix-turn-helix transcriptional regulator n=1 Tax=Cohnella thailandensis TaxID=557557 RepID=A0A841SQ41_9BACL|nr:helix-turn-helix domain-containing protein [Cohnella thailandensis]MBB6634074.1 helix-turn-helix transcriptional regulator [Cohnella thailandensis]MBP1972434.1 DNA-binding transcriptional ArsR family regulator [Cohnella thailandensis]
MKLLYHPDREEIHLSSVLYALSDPVRLLIVSELSRIGESACGDIGLPVVKSTVTHHTRTLREAGIIRTRAQGTQRFLSIRRDDLEYRFPGLLTSILEAFDSSEEAAKLREAARNEE